MTDRQFLDAVEHGDIAPADFNHECHVRLAFLRLRQESLPSALSRIRIDLQCLAVRAGRPDIYDEALTIRWMERISDRMQPDDEWATFRDRERDLLNCSQRQAG